mmetsp:Transcript_33930/g.67199  ORF Transcript_33930/g.67199 Transcript_33930/m.67199 type:complete len:290 (-) Transcript_33930:115-984(-)
MIAAKTRQSFSKLLSEMLKAPNPARPSPSVSPLLSAPFSDSVAEDPSTLSVLKPGATLDDVAAAAVCFSLSSFSAASNCLSIQKSVCVTSATCTFVWKGISVLYPSSNLCTNTKKSSLSTPTLSHRRMLSTTHHAMWRRGLPFESSANRKTENSRDSPTSTKYTFASGQRSFRSAKTAAALADGVPSCLFGNDDDAETERGTAGFPETANCCGLAEGSTKFPPPLGDEARPPATPIVFPPSSLPMMVRRTGVGEIEVSQLKSSIGVSASSCSSRKRSLSGSACVLSLLI